MKKKSSSPSASSKSSIPSGVQSGTPTEFRRIESLIDLCKSKGMAELEWEFGEGDSRQRICVRTVGSGASQPMMQTYSVPSATASPSAGPAHAAPKGLADNHKQIASPFVGTYYSAPSPGAKLYVQPGQTIRPGDVLCIVEAMKLMNEIEAEVSGKIVSVLVENGQPVEFGEPLFVVET